MNKKATVIKIIATALQIIPVLVALGINAPIIVSRWDKTVSVAAIVVIIILACIFRDATRKFISTPSAFKFSLVIFISSLLALSLGEQLLIISATSLISGLVVLPLNMWYNYLTRPVSAEELKNMLENNNEESI